MSDSVITSPRSIQQSYYSCPKTPDLQEVLAETFRWPFNGLAETGKIKLHICQNCSQHLHSQTVKRGLPSINHRAENSRVLDEPALSCILVVSLLMFNWVLSTLLFTLTSLTWYRPSPLFPGGCYSHRFNSHSCNHAGQPVYKGRGGVATHSSVYFHKCACNQWSVVEI